MYKLTNGFVEYSEIAAVYADATNEYYLVLKGSGVEIEITKADFDKITLTEVKLSKLRNIKIEDYNETEFNPLAS